MIISEIWGKKWKSFNILDKNHHLLKIRMINLREKVKSH